MTAYKYTSSALIFQPPPVLAHTHSILTSPVPETPSKHPVYRSNFCLMRIATNPQDLAPQRLQVIADRDSLDWKDYDADTICRRVTSKVQPGSIVLFHNAALHTPEALPAILDCLINDGYTVVPISQLILDPPYTIDHTGRQFPAETVSTT